MQQYLKWFKAPAAPENDILNFFHLESGEKKKKKKPQSIRMMSWWHINKARYMPIAKAIVLAFRVFEEWNHILETGISNVEIFLKLGEVWEEVMKRKAKGSLINMMT